VSERVVKLLQGYLWHPRELAWEPRRQLPETIDLSQTTAVLFVDEIEPPFAFFDDGTPSASQNFYQLTAVAPADRDPRELHGWVAELEEKLKPILEATPSGVGWLLLEDLREV